jgi:intein/homing endonuclease
MCCVYCPRELCVFLALICVAMLLALCVVVRRFCFGVSRQSYSEVLEPCLDALWLTIVVLYMLFITKSTHFCLIAGTPVNLATGTSVPIESMQALRPLLAYDSTAPKVGLVSATPTVLLSQGLKKCIELMFADGRTLTCTPDHRLMTPDNEWVEAQDLRVGEDFVSCGVSYPLVKPDEDAANCAAFRLTAASFFFSAETLEARERTSAFVRIVGFCMADGTMSESGAVLFLGHSIDAEAALRDVFLLTGIRPPIRVPDEAKKRKTYDLALPVTVYRALLALGLTPGKRTYKTTHLPRFVLDPTCPLPIVREFLGALFGGDGCTVSVSHSHNSALFSELRFTQTRGAASVEAQHKVYTDEFFPLLERFGIRGATIAVGSKVNQTNAAAAKLVQEQKARGEALSETVRDWSLLNPKKNYAVVVSLRFRDTLTFNNAIGFRYCCHKQQRLSAAACYYRLQNVVSTQKVWIFTRAKELCDEDEDMKEKDALVIAKKELSLREVLHPYTQDYSLVAFKQHRTGSDHWAAPSTDNPSKVMSIKHCLDEFQTRNYWSEKRVNKRYSSVKRAAEVELDRNRDPDEQAAAAGLPRIADEEKAQDMLVVVAPQVVGDVARDVDLVADATVAVVDPQVAIEDDVQETDPAAAAVAVHVPDKVRYAVPRDRTSLPVFRLRLVARREIEEPQPVYDLTVPVHHSFMASGICVHNCDDCHQSQNLSKVMAYTHATAPRCLGEGGNPHLCPLKCVHPPNGSKADSEFFLKCGICEEAEELRLKQREKDAKVMRNTLSDTCASPLSNKAGLHHNALV